MGLLKPKSYHDVDLSDFEIENLDLKNTDDKAILAAAEKIFAMAASLVQTAGFDARTKPDQKQENIERDIGHGIKALFREVFANTCVIRGNILIHHHNRTEHGLGGYEFEENIAWILVGGVETFQAQWGWDSIDAKSLFFSSTPEARGAFREIREKWLELLKDSGKDQQS
jgi:hypothetical protein